MFLRFIFLLFLMSSILMGIPTCAQTVKWIQQLGGPKTDVIYAIKSHKSGYSYVAGFHGDSASFQFGVNPLTLYLNPDSTANLHDAFVAKLDSLGNVVWAKNFHGLKAENIQSLKIDHHDHLIVAGTFTDSVDFDPGMGSYYMYGDPVYPDLFTVKMDEDGGLLWARKFHASNFVQTVVHNTEDNIVVMGSFKDTLYANIGGGYTPLIAIGNSDLFLACLDSNGMYKWVNQIGDTASSFLFVEGSTDNESSLICTGSYNGVADVDMGIGVTILNSNGGSRMFTIKLDSLANFLWAWNGNQTIYPSRILCDSNNNIYIGGYYTNTCDFDPGTSTLNYTAPGNPNTGNVFILKLDKNRNLLWMKQVGNNNDDRFGDMDLDEQFNVYFTGSYGGQVDLDPGAATFNIMNTNTYIVILNKDGNFKWGKGAVFGEVSATNRQGFLTASSFFNPITVDTLYLLPEGEVDALSAEYVVCSLLDTSVNISGTLMSSNQLNGIYQWIDCTTGATLATTPNYTVVQNGSYALVVSTSTCMDTSACYSFQGVGTSEIEFQKKSLRLYPNPNHGIFSIQSNGPLEKARVKVYTLLGQCIYDHVFHSTEKLDVFLQNQQGSYFVVADVDQQKYYFRITME